MELGGVVVEDKQEIEEWIDELKRQIAIAIVPIQIILFGFYAMIVFAIVSIAVETRPHELTLFLLVVIIVVHGFMYKKIEEGVDKFEEGIHDIVEEVIEDIMEEGGC